MLRWWITFYQIRL